MAKNHFSRAKNGSLGVQMGVLKVVSIAKSGLGFLIRAPEVPFLVPQKRQKWAVLAGFGVQFFYTHAVSGLSDKYEL